LSAVLRERGPVLGDIPCPGLQADSASRQGKIFAAGEVGGFYFRSFSWSYIKPTV
jgi:hypothetical protein